MTEPDVASSDATNISCAIRKEDTNYIVNGKKWWISGVYSSFSKESWTHQSLLGAGDPRCKIAITLVKSEGGSGSR